MRDFCLAFCDDAYVLTGKTEKRIRDLFYERKRGINLLVYSSGKKLVEDIKNDIAGVIDILFLDIEMPDMSGIEVKDILVNDPRVRRMVFLTGHMELAIPAFGLKVVSFLVKPVSDDTLIDTILKLEKELYAERVINYRTGGKGWALRLMDLIYISAREGGSDLYLAGEKDPKETEMRLKDWEEIFHEDSVIRVHKSFMVNLYYVKEYRTDMIELMDTDVEIPVGRVYQKKTRKRIDQFQMEIVKERML